MMVERAGRALHRLITAAPGVPVLIYHSVGYDNGHALWRHLTLPVDVFAAQLAWLRREGYRTVSLYDLHAYLAGRAPLPERPIVLTFDDGFLDNWVCAQPLLEHYGFRATLFLCPAFMQAGHGTRTRAAVRAQGITQPGEWWGYLRWDEARAMRDSGVFDIQAHGLTHRRHFTSGRIVDYLRPGAPYYWHRWNRAPDRQPYWLTEPYLSETEYGVPVYEHAEAHVAPRYEPDAVDERAARTLVAAEGGAVFFRRADWRQRLDAAVAAAREARGAHGWEESRVQYYERVRHDLRTCRARLRRELGVCADFLCWPKNEDSAEAHALALDVGYAATTCLDRPNVPGAEPTRIGRTYFGQDKRSTRVARPWVSQLKFRGVVELASGRRAGYPKLFLANRMLTWYDRPAQSEPGGEPGDG